MSKRDNIQFSDKPAGRVRRDERQTHGSRGVWSCLDANGKRLAAQGDYITLNNQTGFMSVFDPGYFELKYEVVK